MTRKTRLFFALVALSLALSATACADTTAPRAEACDVNNHNTCL